MDAMMMVRGVRAMVQVVREGAPAARRAWRVAGAVTRTCGAFVRDARVQAIGRRFRRAGFLVVVEPVKELEASVRARPRVLAICQAFASAGWAISGVYFLGGALMCVGYTFALLWMPTTVWPSIGAYAFFVASAVYLTAISVGFLRESWQLGCRLVAVVGGGGSVRRA